jgi:hypothetical protein
MSFNACSICRFYIKRHPGLISTFIRKAGEISKVLEISNAAFPEKSAMASTRKFEKAHSILHKVLCSRTND